jgi:hypothetical protein
MSDVIPFLERLLKTPLSAGAWLALGMHVVTAAAAVRLVLVAETAPAPLGMIFVVASLFLAAAIWGFERDYRYPPVRVMTRLAILYGLFACLLLPFIVHLVAMKAPARPMEDALPAATPWIVMVLWLAIVAQSVITFYEEKTVSHLFDYSFMAAILVAGIVLMVKYLFHHKDVSARTSWELGSVAVFTVAWLGIPRLRPRRLEEEFWR